jgi:hypothetical protein
MKEEGLVSSSPMASLLVTTMEMMPPSETMMEGKVPMRVVTVVIIGWVIGIAVDRVPSTTRKH